MVEERVILEHEPDPAAVRRNAGEVAAVEHDAPGVGPLEAGDHAEQRALPRAARSQHGDDLALGDVERHAVERGLLAEADRDVLDPKHAQNQPARRMRIRSTRKTETATTTMRITASA